MIFKRKDIGKSIHENFKLGLQLEFKKKLEQREVQLEDKYNTRNETQLENERRHFNHQFDVLKTKLKNDYDKLLKVNCIQNAIT